MPRAFANQTERRGDAMARVATSITMYGMYRARNGCTVHVFLRDPSDKTAWNWKARCYDPDLTMWYSDAGQRISLEPEWDLVAKITNTSEDNGPVTTGEEMQKKARQFDPVARPEHYSRGDIECIDAMRAMLGKEGFVAYCRGTIFKYNWRVLDKDNPPQDAGKCERHARWLQDTLADKPLSKD
jgi:Protein of unknwon function (DUF3310)